MAGANRESGDTRRRVLIGLGTGRCGTLSLSMLLNSQPHAHVTHEAFKYRLDWYADSDSIRTKLGAILERSGHLVGDVHSTWLPHVRVILEHVPECRLICLKRPRQEVISSFVAWVGTDNHWQAEAHAGKWSPCYPKYACLGSREAAIGVYWDDYYDEIARLRGEFPGSLQVFATQDLNTQEGVSRLLAFAGIKPDSRRLVHFHAHRGTYQ